MITEKVITKALKDELEALPYIYAFWIEGSYAMGYADSYSDIDYWIDIDDAHVQDAIHHIEKVLNQLGGIDERYENENPHPKLGQIVYHIKDTNPYLVLDFNWQLHSRDRDEYHYIKNDIVEGALVIFDKDNVVHFEDLDEAKIQRNRTQCREECDYRYSQHFRVEKYMRRATFAECYAYYNKYVIEPLVIMLRLKYTPLYPYHYLLHISNHMPNEIIVRLEELLQISSLEEMEASMKKAQIWYKELQEELYKNM